MWREESVCLLKSLGPSSKMFYTVFCTSLATPEDWNQNALLITTAMAMDLEDVSAASTTSCREAFATNFPSVMTDQN